MVDGGEGIGSCGRGRGGSVHGNGDGEGDHEGSGQGGCEGGGRGVLIFD